jgi:hypothetical protein
LGIYATMQPPKTVFPKRTVQIYDGVIHRYHTRRNGAAVVHTVCCDCGLVHVEEFLPKNGYIRVRVWRDDKHTKEVRKRNRSRKRRKK